MCAFSSKCFLLKICFIFLKTVLLFDVLGWQESNRQVCTVGHFRTKQRRRMSLFLLRTPFQQKYPGNVGQFRLLVETSDRARKVTRFRNIRVKCRLRRTFLYWARFYEYKRRVGGTGRAEKIGPIVSDLNLIRRRVLLRDGWLAMQAGNSPGIKRNLRSGTQKVVRFRRKRLKLWSFRQWKIGLQYFGEEKQIEQLAAARVHWRKRARVVMWRRWLEFLDRRVVTVGVLGGLCTTWAFRQRKWAFRRCCTFSRKIALRHKRAMRVAAQTWANRKLLHYFSGWKRRTQYSISLVAKSMSFFKMNNLSTIWFAWKSFCRKSTSNRVSRKEKIVQIMARRALRSKENAFSLLKKHTETSGKRNEEVELPKELSKMFAQARAIMAHHDQYKLKYAQHGL